LTEEQAKAKVAAMKKGAATKKASDYKAIKKKAAPKDNSKTDYVAIGKKIKAAVEAGKLTEEQAKAKWIAIKKGKGGK
jgi:hypothetical protein